MRLCLPKHNENIITHYDKTQRLMVTAIKSGHPITRNSSFFKMMNAGIQSISPDPSKDEGTASPAAQRFRFGNKPKWVTCHVLTRQIYFAGHYVKSTWTLFNESREVIWLIGGSEYQSCVKMSDVQKLHAHTLCMCVWQCRCRGIWKCV